MIKEINENIYISSSGKKRYLFEIFPKDLEQREISQILDELNFLRRSLHKLSPESTIKAFSLNEGFYLDCSQNLSEIEYYESKKYLKGLKTFIFGKNVHSSLIFKDDYCKVNGKFFRFISVSLKDDHQIDVNEFQKYGEYFITFKKVKTLFSKIMIKDARKMSHSSLYETLSDIEGIETYKENEQMLRKIITREEELFKCEVTFVVRSNTEIEMQLLTDQLIDSLELSGLSPKIEAKSINQAFKNFIPGVTPKFDRPLLFHSSLLMNSLPLHEDRLMKEGVSFHSRSEKDLLFDSRTGDSYSLCITGRTGNGKTVLANKLISHGLNKGRKIFSIDPKGDYRKQALLKNAYIIDETINPMIFKDAVYFRDLILSKIPKEERTTLWEGKLLRAIRETEAFNANNFFSGLEKLKSKGFSDLEFYFEDIIDNISEKPGKVSDYTYIEFSSFSDQSIPFLLSFAFEYVTRLNSPFDFYIDECHRVFDHDPQFLGRRVREMRSMNSSLRPITQSYKDLVSNIFGQIVADNCFHKFFFAQNISEGYGVDEFDISNVNSLRTKKGEYSECYYKSEEFRKVLRYYPTLKELEVFGSDLYQTKKMLSYIQENSRYFTVDECINQWVRNKYA